MRKAKLGARNLDPAAAPVRRDYLLQTSVKNIRSISPRSEGVDAVRRNVFRFLPAMEAETRDIVPYRTENGDQTLWMPSYHIASITGTRNISFIVADPFKYFIDGVFDDIGYGIEITNSPAYVLYNAISTAVRRGSNPNWSHLVKSENGQLPIMFRPEPRYLALGVVISHMNYQFRGKPYGVMPDEPLFLVILSGSAGRSLRDALDSEKWAKKNAVDLDSGLIVAVDLGEASYSGYKAYKVDIMESYKGVAPSLTQYKEEVLRKMLPMEDILYFPTTAEQIELLCNTDIPADAIVYGLQDRFRDLIPDRIYREAENIASGKTKPTVPQLQTPGRPAVDFGQDTGESTNIIEDAPFDIPEDYIAALRIAEEKRRLKQ